MTRKDYIEIGTVYADLRPTADASAEARNLWTHIVERTANMLKRDNPNFQYFPFINYCKKAVKP